MTAGVDDWLTPRQQRQRVIATGLAACIFALLAVLAYALWWKPWSAQHARLQQLLERRDRVEAVLQSRSAVEAASQQTEQAAAREPLLLPEPTRDQAVAGMMQRFQEMVTRAGDNGKHCRIDSQTPVAAGANNDVQRIAIGVRMHCGNSEWLQLAQAVETAQPALFVGDLNIVAPVDMPVGAGNLQSGALDISLTLYGFPRQSMTVTPGAAH